MVGVVIYLFFACAIGIFLGTVARSMPQLGLLYMLVYMPMNMLSGSNTPLESMPPWLATVMQASPSTHFVSFAQSILFRGAGFDVVWPQFLLSRWSAACSSFSRPALSLYRRAGDVTVCGLYRFYVCVIEKDSSLSFIQSMRNAVLSFKVENQIRTKTGADQ